MIKVSKQTKQTKQKVHYIAFVSSSMVLKFIERLDKKSVFDRHRYYKEDQSYCIYNGNIYKRFIPTENISGKTLSMKKALSSVKYIPCDKKI